MNTIGKILVVFITASSLGFLAFVSAFLTGGPDWQGELHTPEVARDFVIEIERTEVPRYSATHRKTDAKVSDKKTNLAEVVLDVRKRLEQDASNQLKDLQPIPQKLSDEIKKTTEAVAADKIGVDQRAQVLTARFQSLWEKLDQMGDDYSNLTIQTQDVMKVAQERREEALRLANQLQLLRNDQFAAGEQRKILEYELIGLEEHKQRLERRQTQLKKQLGIDY